MAIDTSNTNVFNRMIVVLFLSIIKSKAVWAQRMTFTIAVPDNSSRCLRALVYVSCLIGIVGCAGQENTVSIPEGASVQDYYIVDCLLPGQVRKLGNSTYMTPRRPVRTTAQDCNLRGGEYVAFDRADYKTALKVWLPAAEAGDADAQNNVGEIFEQGLGTDPNYEVAALWYGRAAKQGHKGAQFNLGTLYETGKGVPQDKAQALNWYRQAWGITDDSLMYRTDAEQALLAQAEENAQRQQSAVQLARTQGEAAGAQAELQRQAALAAAAPARREEPKEVLQLESDALDKPLQKAEEISLDGRNFGRYYALIIGNADYRHLDNLVTPLTDAARVKEVLERRYHFQVRMLANGDDATVLSALNQLNEELGEDDNLLIYYSGHGNRRQSGDYETGYWLPVNAEQPPTDTYWVPTSQVSGHLARIKARRVMVVADSSYAGLLADNPGFLLVSDPAALRSEAYVNLRYPNKSRLLLTSGKDFPLQTDGKGDNSVFTDALVEALENNRGVLTGPALFLELLDRLAIRSPDLDPEFKAIKRAGDEVGDFFFVAQSS